MKILIIGSEGFIGSHMTKALMKEGHEIKGMDIDDSKAAQKSYPVLKGDIMNPEDILKAAQGMDSVINLAAKHHDFGISREDFFRINRDGTQTLLSCMTKLRIKKHIFYSTVAVYGLTPDCTSEESAINPMNDYGESKLAAEHEISQWVAKDPSREVIIIRPTVVFGPNNWANMYKLIDSIYKKHFVFVGKGANTKSVSYVENLVDATLFLLERIKPGMEIFNYSDYPHHTSAQMIDIITDALGRRRYRFKLPLTPILWTTSIIDILAKITGINFPITSNRINKLNMVTWHGSDKVRDLGFQQKITIKKGLQKMVQWYLGKNT